MRGSIAALALPLALPLGCDSCKAKPTPTAGSRVTPKTEIAGLGPIERWPDGAVYDRDPSHAYNRLFRALYARKVEGSISKCLLEPEVGGCLALSPTTPFSGPTVKAELDLGGDEPAIFLGADVDFLGADERVREIEAAIEASRSVPVAENPLRSALLSNDLWERFDSIGQTLKQENAANRGGLERVRKKIAEFLPSLALPAERIREISPNVTALAATHPDLLPGFAKRDGWVEVRSRFNERRDESLQVGTRHAGVFGNRFVFRVVVRVPAEAGGAEWLRKELEKGTGVTTPPGTRLVLVASPLAIAERGEIVEVPVITLVETRAARETGSAAKSIADAPFDVIEGKRALLVRTERPHGGLERLAPDARLPFGASCSPSVRMIAPLRSTCVTCHGPDGARITGPMSHGTVRIEEETDPKAAGEIVIRQKQADPGFAELRAAFGS